MGPMTARNPQCWTSSDRRSPSPRVAYPSFANGISCLKLPTGPKCFGFMKMPQ